MLANGTLLQNRYLIKRPLAQDGMGTVYEGEALHPSKAAVAIKESFFTEARLREQFQQDASRLAQLSHPALPRVHDHFIEGAGQFLVMDFIPGQDLESLLKHNRMRGNTPFDWRQVLEWADQLLDALEYLHAQQPPVIHRNIRPRNLKLGPGGELFLTDFGLAEDATALTNAVRNARSYTLSHAPPEQIKGIPTDARGDLYSLGATLHHLLVGEMPDNARVREQLVQYGAPDPLSSIHDLNPQVPKSVAEVIIRTLALNPAERYQSADGMRGALLLALDNAGQEIAVREQQKAEHRKQYQQERRRQMETTECEPRGTELPQPEGQTRRSPVLPVNDERKRLKEERQRELAEQRRQIKEQRREQEAEVRRREEQAAKHTQIEQQQAEQRRQEEETRSATASQRALDRKRKKEIEPRKPLAGVTNGQIAKTILKLQPVADSLAIQQSAEMPIANLLAANHAPVVAMMPPVPTAMPLPKSELSLEDKAPQKKRRLAAIGVAIGAAVFVLILVYLGWPHRNKQVVQQRNEPAHLPAPQTQIPAPAHRIESAEALRYWFELKDQTVPVTVPALTPDQKLRLHFKMPDDGYLYLLSLNERGKLIAFLPGATVKAGSDFAFPSGNKDWIQGQKDIQQVRITALLAHNRIKDFDRVMQRVRQEASQMEALEILKGLTNAVSPISSEDLYGRGTPAIAVNAALAGKPLIFDIVLEYANK